jgi:hypothetical protein
MNMPKAKHIASSAPYASRGDFCRIFSEDINELYQLSFLLTGTREKAEQCFVSGLENSVGGNRVFKEWARSWARRSIIQCAVRSVNPKPMDEGPRSIPYSSGDTWAGLQEETAAILELRPFDRFVYVMSVLEHYSDQDCSVLLGCARRDVTAGRMRALQQIGSAMEFQLEQQLKVG